MMNKRSQSGRSGSKSNGSSARSVSGSQRSSGKSGSRSRSGRYAPRSHRSSERNDSGSQVRSERSRSRSVGQSGRYSSGSEGTIGGRMGQASTQEVGRSRSRIWNRIGRKSSGPVHQRRYKVFGYIKMIFGRARTNRNRNGTGHSNGSKSSMRRHSIDSGEKSGYFNGRSDSHSGHRDTAIKRSASMNDIGSMKLSGSKSPTRSNHGSRSGHSSSHREHSLKRSNSDKSTARNSRSFQANNSHYGGSKRPSMSGPDKSGSNRSLIPQSSRGLGSHSQGRLMSGGSRSGHREIGSSRNSRTVSGSMGGGSAPYSSSKSGDSIPTIDCSAGGSQTCTRMQSDRSMRHCSSCGRKRTGVMMERVVRYEVRERVVRRR